MSWPGSDRGGVQLDGNLEALVERDIKGKATAEESAWLRNEALDQWVECLKAAVQNIESQFANSRVNVEEAKQASIESKTSEAYQTYREILLEDMHWRRRVARYKSGVQARLAEAKAIQKQRNMAAANNDTRRLYRALRAEVLKHKERVLAEYDPTPADLVLWEALEEGH